MKDFFKSVSKYFMQIHSTGRDIKIFTYSTLLLILIFCLDILNKPSELITSMPLPMICTVSLGLVALLIIHAIHNHIYKNYKIVSVNYIDSLSIISFLTSSISTLIWEITESFSYKTIGAIILFALSAVSIITRLLVFYKADKRFNSVSSRNAVYDLKSIYDNDFSVKSGNPILISEKDVDYDLLGRKSIIDQLYMNISSYKSDTSYVIGLIGEWGSGKTTIINNLKKKLKDNTTTVCIDDFDPWVFGTQEALLYEMFDKIMQKTGIELSFSKSEALINNLNNIMTNAASDIKIVDRLIDKILPSEKGDISYLTQEISNYLILSNKTVVFFIDNIDRAEADNIIFMFKLIGTVFNLPNIVYVMSYDKKRVDEILKDTKKINPKYTEKIIQQEIYVPKIQYNRLKEICHTCVINILKQYDIKEDELDIYSPIIDYICENVEDLRSFKRLINSVFSNVFPHTYSLDKMVLLAIEIIHFLDFDLYESILENNQYYISSDYIYNSELQIQHFDKNEFDKAAKTYFDNIFINRSSSKAILSAIFPYVHRYTNKYSISDGEYYEKAFFLRQNAPIYSLKFFELYFTYGTNTFLEERNEVAKLVDTLVKSQNTSNIQEALNRVIYTASDDTQKERLEIFQLHLDKIPHSNRLTIIESLWEHMSDIDNVPQFFSLSARDRAIVIITMFLIEMNEEYIEQFILSISNDFSRIIYIKGIIYWLNSSRFNVLPRIKQRFSDLYSNMCKQVIEDKINLYSNNNYRQYNITSGLFAFYKDSENKDTILQDYMESIYKDDYVYRTIADVISIGTGSDGFSYGLRDDSFNILYLAEETIKQSIENNPPSNESEEIIKDIFEKFQRKEMNICESYGISSPTPIVFNL